MHNLVNANRKLSIYVMAFRQLPLQVKQQEKITIVKLLWLLTEFNDNLPSEAKQQNKTKNAVTYSNEYCENLTIIC